MPNKPDSKKTCPLFIACSDREIICKSHINGAERVAVRYWVKSNLDIQMEHFCKDNYRKCEQYLSYKHFLWTDD